MLADIAQGVFEFIFQTVFEVVAYFVGWLAVTVVSVGRWGCDSIEPRARRRKFWNGFYNKRNGRVYLTGEATALIGMLVILLIISGVIGVACGWH